MNTSLRLVLPLLCFGLASSSAHAADTKSASLKSALLLHASFDRGLDADFAKGDAKLYFTSTGNREKDVQPGLPPDGQVVLTKGDGKFGDALHFTKKAKPVLFYRGPQNLGFRTNDWTGACSVWLRLNPDKDLEPGYCDPLQFVGQAWNRGAAFIEFSKDHTPREFRLGMMPITTLWNPHNRKYEEMPNAERPVVQVLKPPFSREQWTHIVFTFGNANTGKKDGWGKLWLNGQYQGELKGWELTFGWEPDKTALTLGLNYVGWLDDLAVFNRPLTEVEIKSIHTAKGSLSTLTK